MKIVKNLSAFVLLILIFHKLGYAYDSAEGCSTNIAQTDRNVFNWRFYLNINPDLPQAGLVTPDSACSHWLSSGISEGRQAHPTFHSIQYLQMYEDVRNEYGITGFWNAVGHYAGDGLSQGRVGYYQNGNSRTTIQGTAANGSKIVISSGPRTAGAIDSLMVNNVELINSHDHGRQLQIAAAVPPYGEDYNPTEAGSCVDFVGQNTTSILQQISPISTSSFYSKITPAFWHGVSDLRDPLTSELICKASANQNVTSDVASMFQFHKHVKIGPFPGHPNIIQFDTQIDISEAFPVPINHSISFETPTGYLSDEFSSINSYNPTTNALSPLTGSCLEPAGCEHPDPLVFSNVNEDYAMGMCTTAPSGGNFWAPVYTPSIQPGQDRFDSSSKWGVGFRLLDPVTPSPVSGLAVYNFRTYIVVGQGTGAVNAVKDDLGFLFSEAHCNVVLSNQIIKFPPVGGRHTPLQTFTVNAIASSELPVRFSASPDSVCTVNGNNVSLVSVGTCTIVASQDGNSNYYPAPSVSQSFQVSNNTMPLSILFMLLDDET